MDKGKQEGELNSAVSELPPLLASFQRPMRLALIGETASCD